MIQHIIHNHQLLSIIIRRNFEKNGIEFFTPDDFSQQLAYMKRPKDYVIPPHVHNPVLREVQLTQEVLFIKSGKVRVDFYDDDKNYLESTTVEAGDVILQLQTEPVLDDIEKLKDQLEVKRNNLEKIA